MQPRTKRQKQVLDFITRFIEKHGYEPSYQQIALHLGVVSKAGIAKHIAALENQGLISRRRENGSFCLELQSLAANSQGVSQIEWLDVPNPNTLTEDWELNSLCVPTFLLGSQMAVDYAAYRVPDDSMIEKHICEGDVALVEKRSYARSGDMVVAVAEKKLVLLHQFFRDGAKTEMRPANPNYQSLIFQADKIAVQGIVRGILRPFGFSG